MINVDEILPKARVLAERCAGDRVPDNLLAMVLSHLRRHRSVPATLSLLSALPQSPFGRRTGITHDQMTSLRQHTDKALARVSDWEEAAWIVGWARRLVRSFGAR
jgi:hypothetical protein